MCAYREFQKALPVGIGLVVGIIFGAVLSAATGNGVWIGLDVSFGFVLAAAFSVRRSHRPWGIACRC